MTRPQAVDDEGSPSVGKCRARRLRGAGAGALVAALIVTAFPVSAAAVPIGTNLQRTPNWGFGCDVVPAAGAFGERLLFPSGQTTCTYLGTGRIFDGSEQAAAPAPGVLVSVRVRAGAQTGPVRAAIVRAVSTTTAGFTCCYFVTHTAPFTPTPNAITQVNVALPMRNDINLDAGVQTVDRLALTVVGPGYPVPAFDGGQPGDLQRAGSLGFYPQMGPNDPEFGRIDGNGLGDFVPLIRGEFLPLCGGPSITGANGGRTSLGRGRQPCLPALAFPAGRARASAGNATMKLKCNDPLGCRSRITLLRKAGGAILAKGSKKVKPVKRRTATIELTEAGRNLVRNRKRTKVLAKVKLQRGSIKKVRRKIKLVRG